MKKHILIITTLITFFCTTNISFAQFTKLFDFGSPNGKGPWSTLISDGTYFYGVTTAGGLSDSGTVFKIKPDGTGYSTIHSFIGLSNGFDPTNGLYFDGTYLYGMTVYGGANGFGVIFKLKTDGSGFQNILNFSNVPNGRWPLGSLISDGTFLYGMASAGGVNGGGTIFKIKPDGSSFLKLFDFGTGTSGYWPNGSLIFDGTFLYGTTRASSASIYGTLFKIKPDGSGFVTFWNFNSTAGGSAPCGDLVSDGTFLYGTTRDGGVNYNGVLFKVKPDGTGYTNIWYFTSLSTSDGCQPQGALVSDGTFLYGLASGCGAYNKGIIFKIKPDGSGYTDIIDFNGPSNGELPITSLFFDGLCFYGLTDLGGIYGNGTLFKLCESTVGTNKLNNDNLINKIYPNPTTDDVFMESEIETEIVLTNVLGETINTQRISKSKNKIDMRNLPNGMYFIKTENAKFKIMKQN